MKRNIKQSLIVTAMLILTLVSCSNIGMGVNSKVARTVSHHIGALAFKSVTVDIFNSPIFESETP